MILQDFAMTKPKYDALHMTYHQLLAQHRITSWRENTNSISDTVSSILQT